jgi:predicted metalloprotease
MLEEGDIERWFIKGFQTGRLSGGNAFEVPYGQL